MAKHSSVVGGSSADRVLNCTGSVELAKTLPPPPSSSFADEGTALHEAIAAILDQDYEEDTAVVGVEFEGIEITQELFDEGIKPSLDFFDDLCDSLDDVDFVVEQRVQFHGIEGAFGTADIIAKAADRSVVLDWKFGKGVRVDAEDNTQLKFYAYAAMMTEATKDLFEPGNNDWPVELIVAQPRMEEGFSRWTTTQKQLIAFARDLRTAVAKVGTDQEQFELGKWCKFCPAKPACPLLLDGVDNALARGLEGLEADIADWLGVADDVIEWANAVKALAHNRAESGHKIPGWKIVAGKKQRNFIDDDIAVAELKKLGLKMKDLYTKKLISPAAAEKALKAVGKEIGEETYEKIVKETNAGTSLVPESDKRPELKLRPNMLADIGKRLSAK